MFKALNRVLLRCTILAVLHTLLAALASAQRVDYLYPLMAEPGLTGTFAEYRPGHLHAGVDLKTWMMEGLPVIAVDDGEVWRVRTSPWGYGKVIYLKLIDGRFAVYAHLSAFSPRIESVVSEEQRISIRYSVDTYMREGYLPVRRGEVIGFSGSTGAGGPHLHFELRDHQHHPINPLTHGLFYDDGRPPTIEEICLRPLDTSSLIEGHSQIQVLPLNFDEHKDIYCLKKTPQISGRVGLSLAVYDYDERTRRPCAIYGLELFLNGQLVFAKRHERFSYPRAHQVDVDLDYDLMRAGWGRFHKLYVGQGNELPFYEPFREGDGILGGDKGLHQLEIRAFDAAGNAAVAQFQILVDRPPRVIDLFEDPSVGYVALVEDPDDEVDRVTLESSTDAGSTWVFIETDSSKGSDRYAFDGVPSWSQTLFLRAQAIDGHGVPSRWRYALRADPDQQDVIPPKLTVAVAYDCGDVIFRITSDELLRAGPQLKIVPQRGISKSVELEQMGPWDYRGVFTPTASDADGTMWAAIRGEDLAGNVGAEAVEISFQLVTRGKQEQISFPDFGISALFKTRSLYQSKALVRVDTAVACATNELLLVRGPFLIEPSDVPFDEPVTVVFEFQRGDSSRLGLYALYGETWDFVGKPAPESGGTISAQVRHFSTFALMEDATPPQIEGLEPSAGQTVETDAPLLSARIEDDGSGLGKEEDIVMTVDGQLAISEYDPERDLVTHRVTNPLSPGKHRFSVMCRDRAGNESRRESWFQVVGR